MKLALRGAVVVVAGTLLALLLSASGLEPFRFSRRAIIAFRIVAVAVFVGTARSTASCGRCAAASPTRRSRCISRSAIRRSKPRSSAPSKRPPTASRDTPFAAPGRKARRAGDRAVPHDRRRAAASSARRCSVTRRRSPAIAAAAALAARLRPGVPAPRPVGAADRLAQRRSVDAVQDRRPARQREGAARRRSGRDARSWSASRRTTSP